MGSPPRGRGKGVAVAGVPVAAGITPAQAGKRRETSDRRNASRDHPRVGGEKHQIDFRGTVGLGSSPHRRGKAHLWIIHQIFIRITPAWAGKRSVELFLSVLSLDHPRVGGEKSRNDGVYYQSTGSPPHRRGKGGTDHSGDLRHGITPAQAGKSSAKFPHRTSARDHPRTGGEKHNVFTLGSLVQGSPPRRRGKATLDGHVAQGHGITPAWAGKRSGGLSRRIRPENHPRVGGEKILPEVIS